MCMIPGYSVSEAMISAHNVIINEAFDTKEINQREDIREKSALCTY